MSDELPRLSAQDVQRALEELYKQRRHNHLFAFYGTGDDQQVAVAEHAAVRILPVRSELELRELLPDLNDRDARIAFLVPWTEDMPLDIQGRFVLNGRVRRIGKEARLKQLFGVHEVSNAARTSALAGYLLAQGGDKRYPSSDSRLTEEAMWAAWLRQDWGVPTEGGLALDTLLGWVALDRRGSQFAAAMAQDAAAGVGEALRRQLATKLGPAGPQVWAAWERNEGSAVMELALLLEALVHSEHAGVRMWVKTKVREALGVQAGPQLMPLATALGRAAAPALRWVEIRTSLLEVRALAKAADNRVDDEELRAALVSSTHLPSAWSSRLNKLGTLLGAAAQAPSPEALEGAIAALRALEGHDFFKDVEQGDSLKRAEMAVRLLAWLTARPDNQIALGMTPYGKAEALGRWYAEEGGYVDWARRWARPAADSPFTRGIAAVVHAADEARAALDRAFAESLKEWVNAAQPANRVVPIDDAVRRIAASFLDGHEERRLLVLLLDGMAWAQAVELLAALGNRAAPWGPLAWHATREGRIGEGHYPVVFAALPTITEVSRSSFFAGKPLKPAERTDAQKDAQRWAANPHAKRFCADNDAPQLLLRAESHTQSGNASQQALALVADPNRRMVAMVLNAIDDELSGSHAMRQVWQPESIASLPILLEKAREHGRAVLLCSDHGHVLYRDKTASVKAPHPGARALRGDIKDGGARWRALPAKDAVIGENEIAIAGSRVWAPRGAEGVVMLMDDSSVYNAGTHAGEHGGASLSEVVAPCLLIGCDDGGAGLLDDAALRVRAAYVPSWWHFELPQPLPIEQPPAKAAAKLRKTNPDQLALLDVGPEPLPATPPPAKAAPSGHKRAPLSAAAAAFAASSVLEARAPQAKQRAEVVRAVQVLLARAGTTSTDVFASEMDLLPYRVGGFAAKLQEVLNLDGYEVLRYDPAARQVQLDKEKLAQLFEVTL